MKQTFISILQGTGSPFFTLCWKILSFPLMLIYRMLFSFSRKKKEAKAKKRIHLRHVPTISIGNLTMGGTGKTGVALSLAQYFSGAGKKVAVILRGYRGEYEKSTPVILNEQNYLHSGDEAQLYFRELSKNARVIVGQDREASWEMAQKSADIVLIDDGFQRCSIPRDLDCLCFSSSQPAGNGSVFPSGYLRQPFKDRARADLQFYKCTSLEQIVHGDYSSVIKLDTCAENQFFFYYTLKKIVDFSGHEISAQKFNNQSVLFFSGLGDPLSFQASMDDVFPDIPKKFYNYTDHFNYSVDELIKMIKLYPDTCYFVCTLKDAVKIEPMFADTLKKYSRRFCFLQVDIKIVNTQGEKVSWPELLDRVDFCL